jgi:hypothetical protein
MLKPSECLFWRLLRLEEVNIVLLLCESGQSDVCLMFEAITDYCGLFEII